MVSTADSRTLILVVDDEIQLAQSIAISLEISEYVVSTASNTADAFKLLEQNSFAAIVTDVKMPGEDGITFLRRVHEKWPKLPVILMTGFAQLEMAVEAIKFGAFDFINKPFSSDHLRKIVERAVNYARLQKIEENYKIELEQTVVNRTSELKNAMMELDLVKSELLMRSAEKNDFMRNISHEMRTPMNGVMGGLSLLQDEVTSDDGKDYLKLAMTSSEKMMAQIEQILEYGQGISKLGSAGAHTERVQLETNLKNLVAKHQPAFDQKKIALLLQIAANVPAEIYTDSTHLNSLLDILIGNALKFTEQGAVALSVSVGENGGNEKPLCFSVIDSGVGVPKDMLERIFEPFVQVDSSSTRRYGGVGLGLAIAKQHALILNGKLWAEQRPEGGSCFKFAILKI